LEPTDADLVRRWRRGDGKAVAIVVRRYTNALGAVAFAILRNRSLAEEAVQETFVRAAARIGRLENTARLGPWLVGIARHVALDLSRKRARTPLPLTEEVAAPGNPGSEASTSEMAQRLREVVAALPEDQRDVFAMKYVAGMSYAAIGQALAMTPEAVSQKLWRVRQKLQQQLEEFLP